MPINYFMIGVIAFFWCLFFTVLLRIAALKNKILLHQGIPLIGGISIGLSFLITVLFVFLLSGRIPRQTCGIVIASFVMLVLGVIDDVREVSVAAKFISQVIATAVLIIFDIRTHIVYIADILNILITLIWIVGVTNAFNFLDIMDGLSAGMALIISFSFLSIALLKSDSTVTILSLALVGATLCFFRHNLPLARVYLGNAGSHFLGFVLAAIAILISYAPLERRIALLSPIFILGLPLFDTLFLILMRMKKGKSIVKKSNDHLALRFLKKGYSPIRTLIYMLGLGLFFSLSGVFLSQVNNLFGIVIVILVFISALFITKKMGTVSIND